MHKEFINTILLICSLIIESTIIRYYIQGKIIPIKNNINFYNIIKTGLIITIINLFSMLYGLFGLENFPLWLSCFFNIFYAILYKIIFFYILKYILRNSDIPKKYIHILDKKIMISLFVAIFLIAFAIDSKIFGTSKDIFNFYHQYELFYVPDIILMTIAIIIFISSNYKKLDSGKRGILASSILLLLGIIADNTFNNYIILSDFFYSIGLIIVFISSENPQFFTSERISAYNFNAFEELVNELIDENRKFYIYAIEIRNFETIRTHRGTRTLYNILSNYADWLQNILTDSFVFYTDNRCFNILSFEKLDYKLYDCILNKNGNIPIDIDGVKVYLWTRYIEVDTESKLCRKSAYIVNGEINATNANNLENKKLVIDDSIYKVIDHERKMHTILEDAFKNDSFAIYIQPFYSINSDSIEGGEILTRISDSKYGIIPPGQFIPICEKNGMIIKLGYIIFEKVCKYLSNHNIKNLGIKYLNINCSAVEFQDLKYSDKLKKIADYYGIDFSIFKFEITESYACDNEIMRIHLKKFKDFGASIVIDDFGKGSSNLSRLREFEFDTVKLDMSIVHSYLKSDRRMLKDIISMLKRTDFTIVAEGVETAEMVKLLSSMGCDYLQGYYFSKPIPVTEFAGYLKNFKNNSFIVA